MPLEFEEDKIQYNTQDLNTATGNAGLPGWMVKKGIAKDNNSANRILMIISIGIIIVSLIVILFGSNEPTNPAFQPLNP